VSSAGSSPPTCAPTWCSTPCGWRSVNASREPTSLVAHTDRGSQYTSADYTQTLTDHGVLASVGTVGDAYDNATAESFVDTFKTELIADRVWRSRSQLELAVVEYVAWFNNERLHESLGDISPAEFEDLYVDSGGRHISPYMKIGSN
jgi:putative transposase